MKQFNSCLTMQLNITKTPQKRKKEKKNETKKTLYSKDYSDHVALYIFPSLLIY